MPCKYAHAEGGLRMINTPVLNTQDNHLIDLSINQLEKDNFLFPFFNEELNLSLVLHAPTNYVGFSRRCCFNHNHNPQSLNNSEHEGKRNLRNFIGQNNVIWTKVTGMNVRKGVRCLTNIMPLCH